MQKYANRRAAGVVLANKINKLDLPTNIILFALPRGGVPVAYEVAKALHIPLDVYLVRKLGVPGQSELAMGAMTQDGAIIFNQDVLESRQVTQNEIDAVISHEAAELKRRSERYRGNRPFPSLHNKTVLLIDDGIATGASLKSAVQSIREQEPLEIIAAVPVADKRIKAELESLVDRFICPWWVDQLDAVGLWYEDFSQTEDEEVLQLLQDAHHG